MHPTTFERIVAAGSEFAIKPIAGLSPRDQASGLSTIRHALPPGTLHLRILVIRRLPVFENFPLGFGKCHLMRAHKALQFDFDPVLALPPILAFPELEREVIKLARVSAERERDDMVQLVVLSERRIHFCALHKHLLHALCVAGGRTRALCISRHANSLRDGRLCNVQIECAAICQRSARSQTQ